MPLDSLKKRNNPRFPAATPALKRSISSASGTLWVSKGADRGDSSLDNSHDPTKDVPKVISMQGEKSTAPVAFWDHHPKSSTSFFSSQRPMVVRVPVQKVGSKKRTKYSHKT